MITRVYGSCNEFTIEFQRREGSDLEIWDAIVPADKDGQYVIEGYTAESENIEYSSLLNLNQLTAEIVKQCFSGHKIC